MSVHAGFTVRLKLVLGTVDSEAIFNNHDIVWTICKQTCMLL